MDKNDNKNDNPEDELENNLKNNQKDDQENKQEDDQEDEQEDGQEDELKKAIQAIMDQDPDTIENLDEILKAANAENEINDEEEGTSHVVVAIAGAPNAGKSTFLNYIVEDKVSIASPVAQTTRVPIRASLNVNKKQLLFIDLPGAFRTRKGLKMERAISKLAWNGLRDTETVLLFINGRHGIEQNTVDILEDLERRHAKAIAVVNKIDAIKEDKKFSILVELKDWDCISDAFCISAKKGYGIPKLLKKLLALPGKAGYALKEDVLSDTSLSFNISEIVREKIFLNFKQEVPYGIFVVTERCERTSEGDIVADVNIVVERDAYKGMVIGASGSTIKQIRLRSCEDLEQMYLSNVTLNIFVKFDKNWKSNYLQNLT